MRDAPSRKLLAELFAAGATVTAYDPVAMNKSRHIFGEYAQLSYVDNQLDACSGADALIIVTEWREFRTPDFDAIKAQLKNLLIFDGRNLYEPKDMRDEGFEYPHRSRLSIAIPIHHRQVK